MPKVTSIVSAKTGTCSFYSLSNAVSVSLLQGGWFLSGSPVSTASRGAGEEEKFTWVCFLLPLDIFFFPFSPHQRKMSFVLGVALGSLSICFFPFLLFSAGK